MMSVVVTATWVLGVMNQLVPHADWKRTFPESAEAIASASNEHNLFPEEEFGAKHTASILLGLAYYESRFNPHAGMQHGGKAFGLFQIQVPTAKVPANLLLLPRSAADIALNLIEVSYRECKEFPWDEKLGWYARGGNGCVKQGRQESRPRLLLAEKIFKEESLPVES